MGELPREKEAQVLLLIEVTVTCYICQSHQPEYKVCGLTVYKLDLTKVIKNKKLFKYLNPYQY